MYICVQNQAYSLSYSYNAHTQTRITLKENTNREKKKNMKDTISTQNSTHVHDDIPSTRGHA